MFSLSGNQYGCLLLPSLQHVSSVAGHIYRSNFSVARFARKAAADLLVNDELPPALCEDSLVSAIALMQQRMPNGHIRALASHFLSEPAAAVTLLSPGSSLAAAGASSAANLAALPLSRTILSRAFHHRHRGGHAHVRLNFTRGFKTRRTREAEAASDGGGGAAKFDSFFKLRGAATSDDGLSDATKSFVESQVKGKDFAGNKDTLRAYIDGLLEGQAAEQKKKGRQADGGSAEVARMRVAATFWDKVQKLAALLVVIACLVTIAQLVNIPGLRFGRANGNEISPEDIDVTFEDVRGIDEAKQELQEIVEFLMNPEKFSVLGGKLPKGCLLVGPPGTGKTLLARAIAGQAGVPFFQAAGSEFDEVLVGQGARRVRDLFKAAKARAPCVIFIDEIDSVGSKRTSSVLHPYANQTINQLLSEMDGFLANEGVIVIGATNRSEDLDRALLRPGRFDTQVTIPLPDVKGRKEILELYLNKIKHDDSINIETLAKLTVGFSGADLENMVNTSAIRAAVDGKESVTMSEFEYSHDKAVLGTDWKSRVRDKEDLRITAYHEAGHTIVAFFTDDSQPLHKVTIVAKGPTGGHTAFLPEADRTHETRAQLIASIDVGMGGRAAEELIFGKEKITGGASSDLQGATSIAEAIVKKLGMSDKFGHRVVKNKSAEAFGQSTPDMSEQLMAVCDAEVSRLLTESYKRATLILRSHTAELHQLAEALLRYETLDAEEIRAILGHKAA